MQKASSATFGANICSGGIDVEMQKASSATFGANIRSDGIDVEMQKASSATFGANICSGGIDAEMFFKPPIYICNGVVFWLLLITFHPLPIIEAHRRRSEKQKPKSGILLICFDRLVMY